MSVRKSHSPWFANMGELDKLHLEQSAEAARTAYQNEFAVYATHIQRTFPEFFSRMSTVISDEGWEIVSTASDGDHDLFVIFNRKPENRRVDDATGYEVRPLPTPIRLNENGW